MRKLRFPIELESLSKIITKKNLVSGVIISLPLTILVLFIFILPNYQPSVPSNEIDSAIWTLHDGTNMKFIIKKHILPQQNSVTSEGISTQIEPTEKRKVFNLECQYINNKIICDNQISEDEKQLLSNTYTISEVDIGNIKSIRCWVMNTAANIYSVFHIEFLNQSFDEQIIEKDYSFLDLLITIDSDLDFVLMIWNDQTGEQLTAEGRIILQTAEKEEEEDALHFKRSIKSPGPILIASCTTLGTTGFTIDPTNYAAQSFIANSGYNITSLEVYGQSSPGGAGTLTAQIYSDNLGVPNTQIPNGLTTAAVASNKLVWTNFTFSPVPAILANTQYWIVISFDNAKKPYSWYYNELDEYTNGYTAGYDGVSWTSYQATYPNRDCNFKLAGVDITPPVIDTITVSSSNPQYIQLNPEPLDPTGGTCYFNSASDEGAGQILTVTVTWTEINKNSLSGEPAFGDTPANDTDGGDGWSIQYSVELGAGNQGNILFIVQDQEGNTDTATIIFENDNTVGVSEFYWRNMVLIFLGLVVLPLIQGTGILQKKNNIF